MSHLKYNNHLLLCLTACNHVESDTSDTESPAAKIKRCDSLQFVCK